MIETPMPLTAPNVVREPRRAEPRGERGRLLVPRPTRTVDEAYARRELRAQIARLEQRVSEMVDVPRRAAAVRAGAVRPRLLSLTELERVRDALVVELQHGQAYERARDAEHRRARRLLEDMLADPVRHRWMRISAAAVGEPGCGVYEVRPRLGLIGMLAGWWEVKLSSGCP